MPGQDQTGPLGQGSMTGRGLGICSGSRRGLRVRGNFGRGQGRGFGRRFVTQTPVTQSKKEIKQVLEEDLKDLEAEKEELQEEIKDLEKSKE